MNKKKLLTYIFSVFIITGFIPALIEVCFHIVKLTSFALVFVPYGMLFIIAVLIVNYGYSHKGR